MHKLHWTEILEKTPSLAEGLVMIMLGQLSIDKNGLSNFQLTFARSQTLISVEEWVKQPFFNVKFTVWELIKSVADKEAAHSDIDYDQNLLFAKHVQYVNDEVISPQ